MSATSPDRVKEIKALHDEICGAVRTSLEKARRIGELLTEQKKEEGHNNWGPWMSENLDFSEETARNYMRVFRYWDEIKSVNVTDLTEAYKYLRKILRRADPPELVEVKLTFSIADNLDFNEWIRELMEDVFHTTSTQETILAAVLFAREHKEWICGQLSSDNSHLQRSSNGLAENPAKAVPGTRELPRKPAGKRGGRGRLQTKRRTAATV